MNLEGNANTVIIIKRNVFFDNLSSNSAIMLSILDKPLNLLSSNYIIQNYGSDALPYQKSSINIYKYFPPGNGASAITFKSFSKDSILVSLNDTYHKNFGYKTGNFR